MKKIKKLTDYLKKPSVPEEKEEEKGVGGEGSAFQPKLETTSSTDILTELLETATRRFEQRKSATSEELKEPSASSKETTPSLPMVSEKHGKEIPEISDKLAEEASKYAEAKIITCDKSGMCSDGKRIGEVYEDEKGIRWQRGFVNTTRLPIFVDFVVEEAEVKGYVGKAIIVESSRGARAIIPEDYICEVISRYGILVKIDKCTGYRASPWVEKNRGRKR